MAILCALIVSPVLAGEAKFLVSSPAFEDGNPIPSAYSRRGGNANPPLVFSGTPTGARSLALVMDDSDAPAGAWVHWLVANLPPDASGIATGVLPRGAVVGVNGWGAARYDGPQPPAGVHHYGIHLYALDARLDLRPGFSRADLSAAMKGHVLAEAQLAGTFAAAP